MKKAVVILLLCGWTFMLNAQNPKTEKPGTTSVASVEKSIFGIQTGFFGIWVHNEFRISNRFALRSEAGFDASFIPGDSFNRKNSSRLCLGV